MEARGATPPVKRTGDRIWFRTVVCVLTLLIVMLAALSAASLIVCFGPSPTAGELFLTILSAPEPAGFPARVYDSFRDIVDNMVYLSSK